MHIIKNLSKSVKKLLFNLKIKLNILHNVTIELFTI